MSAVTAVAAWLLTTSATDNTPAASEPDIEAFEMEDGMLAAAGLEDLGLVKGRNPQYPS